MLEALTRRSFLPLGLAALLAQPAPVLAQPNEVQPDKYCQKISGGVRVGKSWFCVDQEGILYYRQTGRVVQEPDALREIQASEAYRRAVQQAKAARRHGPQLLPLEPDLSSSPQDEASLEGRCGLISGVVRVGKTRFCVSPNENVYYQTGEQVRAAEILQKIRNHPDYRAAHGLARYNAIERSKSSSESSPAEERQERRRGPAPPYLQPGYVEPSEQETPAYSRTAEQPRPAWTPSSEQPEARKNRGNDWAGYILTGFGLVGIVYGLLGRDTCNELTGEEIECTDEIKSKQENARFLFVGGSFAVTGLGMYFLMD